MSGIFLLPQFNKSFNKKNNSEYFRQQLKREMQRLYIADKNNQTLEYLINNRGIPLTGHPNQYKYHFDSGDRIFYTYGKHVKNLDAKYSSAIVIYSFSKHDEQDRQNIPVLQPGEQPQELKFEDDEIFISEISQQQIAPMMEDFKSWNQTHPTYIIDSDHICDSLDDADVTVSTEQAKIINSYPKSKKPLLILGGAGTGKTVMALHILNNFISVPEYTKDGTLCQKKCIYFTQSDALKTNAETKFENILKDRDITIKNEVEFKNINDFSREFYNKKNKNINPPISIKQESTMYDFFNFFDNYQKNSNHRLQINKYDLWAEIRGTIKGGLNEKWQRPHIFNKKNFHPNFINKQLKNIRISRDENGTVDLITELKNAPNSFVIKDFTLFNKVINGITDAQYSNDCININRFKNEVDYATPLITEEEYNTISAENSTLPKEQRELYYTLAEEYQKYLVANKRFDDNDLMMKVLSLQIKEEDKYDLIVIDEIQDYTELQIYTIFQFAKNNHCIVMSGDTKQIINPTIFSENRIRQYFRFRNPQVELNVESLSTNYRCPKEIVAISNSLHSLSDQYIGKQNAHNDETSCFNTYTPFKLKYNKVNLQKLIENLLIYPSTAILVSSQQVKNELIDKYGRKEYESKHNPIIYTVSEIKGMEYDYVVAYNIITDFANEWNQILSGKASHQTRFRYYFNLFYVTITRSQKFLCFLESDDSSQVYQNILNNDNNITLKEIDEFNADQLKILSLSRNVEKWLDEAKQFIKQLNYIDAREKLSHISNDNNEKQELLLQCNRLEAIEKHDDEQILKTDLLLNELSIKDLEDDYKKYEEISSDLNTLIENYLYPSKLKITYSDLISKIENVYKKDDNKEQISNIICFKFIKRLSAYVSDSVYSEEFDLF